MTHNAASGKGPSLVKAKGGSSPQTTRQRDPLSREGPQSVLDVASSGDTLSYRQIGYRSGGPSKGTGAD